MINDELICDNCSSELDEKTDLFECYGCALMVCIECTDDGFCGGCQDDAKEIEQ